MAVSLGVALLFWLSVKLSAHYHTVVEVPVAYRNLPSALQLRAPLPPRLAIEVDARGAQLLAHALGGDDTLRLDLADAARSGALPRERLLLQVEGHFPATVQVRSIRPDSLALQLEQKGLRQLPVYAPLTVVPPPGWWQQGPLRLVPDSVRVLAPRELLDSARHWPTPALTLVADVPRWRQQVPLLPLGQALAEPASVTVEADFERYTEGRLRLPLTVANLPPGAQLRLAQPQVQLRYLAAWAEFPYLDADDFTLEVDAAQLHPDSPYLPVRVVRAPAGVRGLQVDPPLVRAVLSRRL